MKQQDIVDAVNRLTVGYSSSWDDIKYDADKAILKINSYLGANYPKMSDILRGPYTPYAVKQCGKYINIFPDKYILSIVVPFIASEILARDEEFTTIYNKYILEVEDGLFTMFSNEFNRVPIQFRQPETTGVFFTEDVPQHDIQKHIDTTLPVFTFSINYHINNSKIIDEEFFYDAHKYKFGEDYSIYSVSDKNYFSVQGDKVYTLLGWYYDEMCTQPAELSGKIYSDIDLYGRWDEDDTMDVYYTGEYAFAYLKLNYPIKYLSVPRYINGVKVTGITGADSYHKFLPTNNKIETIVLPDTLEVIEPNALVNFKGSKLIFPESGNIDINTNGLYMPDSKLVNSEYNEYPLILTRAVKAVSSASFGSVSTSTDTKRDTVNVLYYPALNVFNSTASGTQIVTDKKIYKIIARR